MTQTQIIRQLTLDGNVLLLKPKPVRRRKVPNVLSKYIVIAEETPEPFCPKEVELPKLKAISESIPQAKPDEPVPEPEPVTRSLTENLVTDGLANKLGYDVAKLIESFAGSAPNNIPEDVWNAKEHWDSPSTSQFGGFSKGYSLKDQEVPHSIIKCPWKLDVKSLGGGLGPPAGDKLIVFDISNHISKNLGKLLSIDIFTRKGNIWNTRGVIIRCDLHKISFIEEKACKEYTVMLSNVIRVYMSYEYAFYSSGSSFH